MRVLSVLLLIFTISVPSAVSAEQLDNAAEVFGRLPRLSQPIISPDGKYLAVKTPKDGRSALVILSLEERKPTALLSFDKKDYDNIVEIGWYRWVSPERLLVSINAPTKRGNNRVPTVDTRLISMNVDGSDIRTLLHQPRIRFQSQSKDDVISFLPDDPDHILMAFAPEGGEPSVYEVNVHTDKRKRVKKAISGIWSWEADWEGDVRLGFGYSGRRKTRAIVRRKGGDDGFEQLFKLNPFKEHGYYVDGFADQTHVYINSAHETGLRGMYLLDLVSGEIAETVFRHENVDVEDILYTPAGKPLAISYTTDRHHYHPLDESFGAKYKGLNKVLPDRSNIITNVSDGGRFWTVYSYSSSDPGDFYILDTSNNNMEYMGNAYPQLANVDMAPSRHITYEARDGLKIPAYITLPPNAGDKPLPFVILPHGGPYVRDTEAFDFWAQYLAHIGYGVIQPNFRGSSGYGDGFEAAGYGEWGRKMQDDVTDATHWVIKNGLADPERICIAGGSYGGYAAFMGVIREPGLYKCAVSLNGLTDMPLKIREWKKFVGLEQYLQVVRPGDDDTSTRDISPVHNIDKINVPVLLVQGDIDRSVSVLHGRRMAKALRRADVEHKYIEQEDGDHFLSYENNRIEFLREMGTFLDKHLK